MKNWQPKTAMALFTVAGGRGDPPEDTTLKLVKSSWGTKGLLTSRVTIVEAKLVQDTRSRSATHGHDHSECHCGVRVD